jgi:hypothetical protein
MSRLTENEKDDIFASFPKIELCFETMIHKTVQKSNYCIAIPEGRNYFTWYTIYKAQNICCLMEITDNKKIGNIEIVPSCFHNDLIGTIFYGTVFKYNNTRFFTIEDMYYYKGDNVSLFSYSKKLNLFEKIFKTEIKQVTYTYDTLVIGLPIISSNLANLNSTINLLPYKIKSIQFRYNQHKSIHVLKYNKNMTFNSSFDSIKKREIVFKITADIQNDIYNLYGISESGEDYFYDHAYIPDYVSSVKMNKLFRNIKENQNLDALEESDDEEEFENDRTDKFVYLDRTFNMKCEYNIKFKRWQPIKIAHISEKVISKMELIKLK